MSHVENQQRKSSWKEIYDGISYQTLFHAFFSPASRSSLHGGLFDFGCIMSTKGCSLPMPNLCEVSIFPFHVMMGNSFFFLPFPGNFCTSHQLWEEDWGGGEENIYVVLLFQRANCTIFFFYLTG